MMAAAHGSGFTLNCPASKAFVWSGAQTPLGQTVITHLPRTGYHAPRTQ